ncbi:MAG: lamin tail domain-containing protein [Thaumarchaeota archaeon]|nr:lamin tail domain-containing protein [Nitrososphaerota archaeon]
MNKSHVIFSILIISILISVPFMQAYSQFPSLKINEMEFNPPGKISGNQWIEIYNPSNFLLDISNFLIKSVELGRSIQVSSGFVVEPNGYVVIPFQTRVFDEKRDSIVLLTPDSVEIDKTPFLSDEVDDDKTWQRFPNAIDNDNITDWHFRDNTFRITNGFPFAKQKLFLSDPIFIDQQGNNAEVFIKGQIVGVKSEIINNTEQVRSFVYIIQVKNEVGIPLFIGWIEDIKILPNITIKPITFFPAESKGEYTIDVFIWRSITLPDPLTSSKQGWIRVAG